MPWTIKQQEFLYNATHRWNIKEGATRSGKTYLDYFVIPMRITKVLKEAGLVVLLGNTRGTLQRNIIEPLQDLWGTEAVSSIKSDNSAYIFGQKCFCLGADKVSQVDRLRGSSIKYCYGDEVVTWNEEVFQMLKSRLDKPYSKFDGTCNPDSPNHWFYNFLQNKDNKLDLYRQTYNIFDNPTLDADFVSNLQKEYAGTVYYERFINGKWVRAEGLIYDIFSEKHIIEAPEQVFNRHWAAVDYGTQNATCFLLFGMNRSGIIVLKEYYYSGKENKKQKTDNEYCQDLLNFIKGYRIENIVIDPSAASFIAECRQKGLPVQKADNSVLDGIRKVSGQFSLDRLKIDKQCVNLIRELKEYSWDDKSYEERPLKENDHACDALRYGIMYGVGNIFIGY